MRLNTKQRKKSATIEVDGKGKFPIPDKRHAIAAAERINQAKPPLTPEQREKVERREAKFGVGPLAKRKAK